MDKLYYYTGMVVVWLIILVLGAVVLLILAVYLWRFYRWLGLVNAWNYHVQKITVDSEELRTYYALGNKIPWRYKRYLLLYRLRNIKNSKN